MKQIIKTLHILFLILLISQVGVGQVKKPVVPPKKTVGPPKKGGVQPKKMTTEDLFKRYLVTEDEALANTIIQSKDSLYGFYCRGILSEEVEEKAALFTKFIDLNPKVGLAKGYLNRGVAYVFSEKFDLAVADFDKAIALEPKEKYSYYFRGSAYHSLAQDDKAIPDFNEAIKLQPTFMMAYQMRGTSYIATKDFKSALADMNKVVAAEPMNDQGYLLRGMAYDGLEEYNLAINDWKEAKKLNKDNSETATELIDQAKLKMKNKK
jgi:tetratricopeptide (TPR) repeat protein